RRDLSDAAEVAYLIGGLLTPIVPRISAALFAQLNQPPLTLRRLSDGARYPLLDRARPLGSPAPLIARLEETQVNTLIQPSGGEAQTAPGGKTAPDASAAGKSAAGKGAGEGGGAGAEPPGEIEYQDFARVALKVGRVVAAERVPKADKLLKLT